ncbi:ShET2/EspL2 family type III secretion system effector toxin [Candidatus Ichthyocystis sparus]|nr:ShET2/EspL2 family type III secretion system effector toxin [Candidatus Ichthyocystis sparus]
MAISASSPVRVSAFSGEEMLPGDKSVPYISKLSLQQKEVALNCEVNVRDINVSCSHLSALYIRRAISCHVKNEKLVVRDIFGSAALIESLIPQDIGSIYEDMLDRSCGRYIVACRKFGGFLCDIAKNTSIYEQRLFLLSSSNHIMAVKLLHKISYKTLQSRYVVCFFDPNRTDVVARAAVNDPSDFLDESRFSLQNFVGSSLYGGYFKILAGQPEECECLVYEYCELKDTSKDFLVLQTLSQCRVSSCMLFHLMSEGSANDVMEVVNVVSSLDPGSDFRREIFWGRSSAGIPALNVALGLGRHENIVAYGSLLDTMSDDEMLRLLPDLLRSEDMEGTPGLFLALKEGHAKSVGAYGNLLDRLLLNMSGKMTARSIAGMVFNLLMARRNDGLPGLFRALQGNHHEAVTQFCSLLDRLLTMTISDELSVSELCGMIYSLLVSKRRDGVTGLQIAISKDSSESVRAFGELLMGLTRFSNSSYSRNVTKMVFKLLMAESLNCKSGLCLALSENKSNSVDAYGELLVKFTFFRGGVSDYEFQDMFHELLIARSNGVTGLFMALQNGCKDSIEAFTKLVNHFISLSAQMPRGRLLVMLYELFMSSNCDGVPGLFMALQQGNGDSIVAFSVLLEQLFLLAGGVISIEEIFNLISDILVAKDNFGRPGLNAALAYDQESSVSAFGVLLEKLDFFVGKISENEIFSTMYGIIMSINHDGCPGLFSALRDNCASVITKYFLLVSKLPRIYWAGLLIAKDIRGVPAVFMAHNNAVDEYYRLLVRLPMDVFLEVHAKLTEVTRRRDYLDVVNRGGGSRVARYELFLGRLAAHKNDQSGASCNPRGCRIA